jgi:hypothetical protein
MGVATFFKSRGLVRGEACSGRLPRRLRAGDHATRTPSHRRWPLPGGHRLAVAEEMMVQALAHAPNVALAHQGYGQLLILTNRAAQGIAECERFGRVARTDRQS